MMDNYYKSSKIWKLLPAFLLFLFSGNAWGQTGLIINEASNGPSGALEYYELLLVGFTDCRHVDVRGWIIDDNNGDFSCGPASGSGIAPGHVRLNPADLNWSYVPIGSIILIYNDTDPSRPGIPADDPADSNGDSIYIVPISHPSLEVATGSSGCPGGTLAPLGCDACPGSGNSGYNTAGYSPGANWSSLGMRNGGDAAQVRRPDGSYFHGISFGSGMTGGTDNLLVSTSSGTGQTFFFSDADFRDVANFSSGPVATAETPGAPNNAANAAYVASLQAFCPLPVIFKSPLTAVPTPQGNRLAWTTFEETNFDRFVIERADESDMEFRPIGSVQGNAAQYSYVDQPLKNGTVWYRLKIVDLDGSFDYSRVAAVYAHEDKNALSAEVFPNPAQSSVNFLISGPEKAQLSIFDLQGRMVWSREVTSETSIDLGNWPKGLYAWQLSRQGESRSGKLIVQ